MKILKYFLIIFIFLNSPIKADSNEAMINELQKGGKLIFIRHAYAPGGGDPSNFDINNCETQAAHGQGQQEGSEFHLDLGDWSSCK